MPDAALDLHRLIIYRSILENNIIKKLNQLLINMEMDSQPSPVTENIYYDICSQLLLSAAQRNITGDLWKDFIIGLLMDNENPFSLAAEKNSFCPGQGLDDIARFDIEILKNLYDFNWLRLGENLNLPLPAALYGLSPTNRPKNYYAGHYYRNAASLRQAWDDVRDPAILTEKLAQFYHSCGCGVMGRYCAFRWEHGLQPIENPDPVLLEDLVGYQYQKGILINNTQAFVRGVKANNILLHGEKGTGKSSSVKALLNRYASAGLRMIELSKNRVADLGRLMQLIKDRGHRFIVFIDDLSFEDFEVEYKYVKASIEGNLEVQADNVLLYVTSNRRHLIRENWNDRIGNGEEIHVSDSYQEKLSFADRFGITLTFQSPDQDEYLQIVEELADREGLVIERKELQRRALQWEMTYHGRSGRSARQFVIHLGTEPENR